MEGKSPYAPGVSAYWIIPGACFGLSAVTAMFMKYRDHMLKVKSNAENLESWTDHGEIEDLKAQIQEKGKLCSLIRAELEQALQQEEQSVEELQWLVRDIERQKELEKEALRRRNAAEHYRDRVSILRKELAWWKERARCLKDGSMTADETETLKSEAERVLLEKERALMKKKRALHELRRQRWEKPFRAINPTDIDSISTEYSSALNEVVGSDPVSGQKAVSMESSDTFISEENLPDRDVGAADKACEEGHSTHVGGSEVDAPMSLRAVLRKLSGSSVTPPLKPSGWLAEEVQCGCLESAPLAEASVEEGCSHLKVRFAASRDVSESSVQPSLSKSTAALDARLTAWTPPRRLSSSSLAFTYEYAGKSEASHLSESGGRPGSGSGQVLIAQAAPKRRASEVQAGVRLGSVQTLVSASLHALAEGTSTSPGLIVCSESVRKPALCLEKTVPGSFPPAVQENDSVVGRNRSSVDGGGVINTCTRPSVTKRVTDSPSRMSADSLDKSRSSSVESSDANPRTKAALQSGSSSLRSSELAFLSTKVVLATPWTSPGEVPTCSSRCTNLYQTSDPSCSSTPSSGSAQHVLE